MLPKKPDTVGDVLEYSPGIIKILVSLGIWAIGMIIYTMLVRATITIEMGKLRMHSK